MEEQHEVVVSNETTNIEEQVNVVEEKQTINENNESQIPPQNVNQGEEEVGTQEIKEEIKEEEMKEVKEEKQEILKEPENIKENIEQKHEEVQEKIVENNEVKKEVIQKEEEKKQDQVVEKKEEQKPTETKKKNVETQPLKEEKKAVENKTSSLSQKSKDEELFGQKEGILEVPIEDLEKSKKKSKELEWRKVFIVLQGQHLSVYPEQFSEVSNIKKSQSMLGIPSDDEDDETLTRAHRSSSFEALPDESDEPTASTIKMMDDTNLARKSSFSRAKSVDNLYGTDLQRTRSRSDMGYKNFVKLPQNGGDGFLQHAKSQEMLQMAVDTTNPEPLLVINLEGAKLSNENEKLNYFHLESGHTNSQIRLRAPSPEEQHLWIVQIKSAIEWTNKISVGKNTGEPKNVSREATHCIPHRLATDNFLLRRCNFCEKIIKEFKSQRCIYCGECFHLKCGKYAPPNCGLSGLKVKKVMKDLGDEHVKDKGKDDEKNKAVQKVKNTLSARMNNKGDELFGIDLAKLPGTEDGIPAILKLCVQAIEQRGMESVGIYRVSGVKSEIDRLRLHFSFGRPNLVDVDEWNDINVIAGVLKAWLRELPNPLLTEELFPEFMKISQKKIDLGQMASVLKKLPPQNYAVLSYLICHLNKVTSFAKINKMKSENIGALFGPNILRTKDDKQGNLNQQLEVTKFLIENYSALFEKN